MGPQGDPQAEARRLAARWVRPQVRALRPYAVPPAGDLVKLDAMENPYRWPPELVEAWLERLRRVPLNRYPDPEAAALKAALRRVLGVPEAAGLVLGNGSDELIQMILLAVAGPGRVALAPEPTFSMYRILAAACGLDYVGVPLGEGFALDGPALLEALARHRPAVLFLAYPNNPTGNLFDRAWMERLLEAAPGLVVVDEAYAPFCDASFLDRAGAHPRLLVLRTLSKLGLAGLRLGLLAGPGPWLEEIGKLRLPYNIGVLTQASALFALEHWEVLEGQARRIRADRERLAQALGARPGVRAVYPSQANFLLFRVGRAPAVFEGLRRRGVLVRLLEGAGPGLEGCLRVTVGTPEENAAFLEALDGALAEAEGAR
ncbi:MAG: histidinol-phosphate transaminase [Gammaproteobacteria bacterium]|nr:MAG: histidinol-phosphate transaminase [Gammaproteobacteria bacterium]